MRAPYRSGNGQRQADCPACKQADMQIGMLPVTREAIARMARSLPDKRSAANPIRQGIPNAGSPEPDRPLALSHSRNRPALGASSNEGDRDSGARSKPREAWLGKVWKGQRALPCRCASHRRGWPSAGGNPQEDRTQISKPQVKSLHKCALRGASFRPGSQFSRLRLSVCEAGSGLFC
jgi:hypothetical protein